MRTKPGVYPEGRGPQDFHNFKLYNVKLTQYLKESIHQSDNDPKVFAK